MQTLVFCPRLCNSVNLPFVDDLSACFSQAKKDCLILLFDFRKGFYFLQVRGRGGSWGEGGVDLGGRRGDREFNALGWRFAVLC